MSSSANESYLLQLVSQWRDQECQRLLERARRESNALLSKARGRVRRDVHEAIVDERRRACHRITAAAAELETLRRRHRQALGTVILEAARQRLPERLSIRWADARSRRIWIRNAVLQANERLPAGRWKVRHPPCFQAADCDGLIQAIMIHAREEPILVTDTGIDTGLIIESAGVILDASSNGLLGDTPRIQARLLALLEGSP